MFDSILFDLDGTLWDSTYTIADYFKNRLKELNYNVILDQPKVQSIMGCTMTEIADIYFSDYPKEIRMDMLNEVNKYKSEYLIKHGGFLYDDVEKMLDLMSKKFRLFIVSNCTQDYLEAFFTHHKLEKYFEGYENARTNLNKDENIKLVIKNYNLKNPVYVGDIEKDRISANNANIPFIHAEYGFGKVENKLFAIQKPMDLYYKLLK